MAARTVRRPSRNGGLLVIPDMWSRFAAIQDCHRDPDPTLSHPAPHTPLASPSHENILRTHKQRGMGRWTTP
ncbi:hypothetical protein D9623_24445 [Azospirillum brasilense]|uniref:Uncharacterized protein n=1 Tax=Azospirillum brasilense TaxID=192 RepID=A0A4D8QZ75_AZOBR|nr:hypothetical protein D3868_22205 [Azospirillum brasilense]QEL93245.1 hypothetical protein D9621_24210 [Azospirillum brasilense]QEL99555.1 hypothetical protein D9623_24445 [Azospirillum brasilense]